MRIINTTRCCFKHQLYISFTLTFIFFYQSCQAAQMNDKQQVKIAQIEKEKESSILKAKKLSTIRVYPDILTNLSTIGQNQKKKYILLSIDLIAKNPKFLALIENNQPLFRDRLILFLNNQKPVHFSSKKHKRIITKRITNEINESLYPELKTNTIKGIIIQKLIIE